MNQNNIKKLFAILLVTVLTSCGGSSSSEPAWDPAIGQSAALEPPKSNTDYRNIIGKPIKLGNGEVAQFDFPKEMRWGDANKECENLGRGWRLPTKEELVILYQNKDKIGGFADVTYWSSTEYADFNAWYQDIGNGSQYFGNMSNAYYVRAVRTF